MSSANKEKYTTAKQIEEYLPFHKFNVGNSKYYAPHVMPGPLKHDNACSIHSNNELNFVHVLSEK
jgi:hypothetical protein